MAVVEKVIEAASMEAIGGSAVVHAVKRAFAHLHGVGGSSPRGSRTRTGDEGGPIIASGISAVWKFGDEDGSGGIFHDILVVSAWLPLRELGSGDVAILEINAHTVSGVRQRSIFRGNDEFGSRPVHGVAPAAAVGRPVNALLDFIGRALQKLGNATRASEAARNTEDEVRFGSGAADVAMDIVVPGKLVLIIAGGIGGGRNLAVMVGGPHGKAEADLFEVAGALETLRPTFGSGQGGKEQTGKDGDNRDDHEQFDESERAKGNATALSLVVGLFHRNGVRNGLLVGKVNLQIFIDGELFSSGSDGSAREVARSDDFVERFGSALLFGSVFSGNLRKF